ncbi:hypothetical protein C5E07_08515 [Pseudoclavibacter sp. RFBJ3]|uniref:recombinase family protein n=1 Tax=unclassified Pseudoclavibacter TaxID=2615177 RepID=UPI000CE86EFA|nr:MULTISPECIES: recombinase family protein [unclassified Pseudoclavibacter]PPF84272.1 hypothetical protein C5C12_07450 [Pseudoclavibacter sp. RFBJ5]PPF92827.1 hypothetical protein C5E07_08515 [Pseudoclavibacter sp. RFBJ3]PPF98100.1 hypothetical protein C5C19_09725 [Pseudoclavibacter sp. RFBH5]PPG25170.1 hypothetical protein C5E13_03755 [Pseudoclavibacter sp. RFBI4]
MTNRGNAAIYCRISRDAEGDAAGVQRQEAACRELAARLGLKVAHVRTDNDVGAHDRTHKSKVRLDYSDLLLDARTEIYTHILAYSNSRLTRQMSELSDLVNLVRTTVSPSIQLPRATTISPPPMASSSLTILTSVDTSESNKISERQMAAFRANARKAFPSNVHELSAERPMG